MLVPSMMLGTGLRTERRSASSAWSAEQPEIYRYYMYHLIVITLGRGQLKTLMHVQLRNMDKIIRNRVLIANCHQLANIFNQKCCF